MMTAAQTKRPRIGLVLRNRGLSLNHPSLGKQTMANRISPRRRVRKLNPLPLLEWANHARPHEQVPSLAVRRLQRQGFSASTAALYADLAGLPREED